MSRNGRPFSWVLLLGLLGVVAAGEGGCASPDGATGPTGSSGDHVTPRRWHPLAAAIRGKPAAVPDDYVVTPNGYFHASCVIDLAQDDVVDREGNVVHADGTKRLLPGCEHPSYDRLGVAHLAGRGSVARPVAKLDETAPQPPPTVSGWMAASWNTTSGPLDYLQALWTVPSAPALTGGEVVYFFPGLEPLATDDTILQPVLGYFYGSWEIQSWNCCKNGYTWNAPPQPVSSGDTIFGTIQGAGCNGSACAWWTVTTSDWSNGASSTLGTTSYGEQLDFAIGGALEAYGIEHCAMLPASGWMQFTQVAWQTTGGAFEAGPWSNEVFGSTPNCAQNAGGSGNEVTITTYPTTMGTFASPSGCGIMYADQALRPGQSFSSCDGRFTLAMQYDGNLVLYQNGVGALWATGTDGTNAYEAIMQGDGNFVLYDQTSQARWSSGTPGQAGALLAIQDDGNLVVYQNGTPLWASNTCCR